MTTTRYFEVKVTGCKNCPESVYSILRHEDFCGMADPLERYEILIQNKDQLTPSCPMWNETKESETK